MELFAVFSTPKSYAVMTTAGQPVGSLTQEFVDSLVESVSSFLLGGRAWAVQHINHNDRQIFVIPAPVGKQPSWGGFLPQFLGYKLCRQILRVLTSTDQYTYLEDQAREVLAEERGKVGRFLDAERGGIDGDTHELRWWTFAGGRINSTLRYALAFLEPDWTFIPDNFAIRIRGESPTSAWLEDAIRRIAQESFWLNEELLVSISESLPNYRLTKFQPLMPDWVEREILQNHLLDIQNSIQVLRNHSIQ
jgi:ATP-dependent Lhr-like helicase